MLSAEVPVPVAPAPRPVTPSTGVAKASIGVNVNLCDLVDEGFAVDDAFEVRDSDDVEGRCLVGGAALAASFSPRGVHHCFLRWLRRLHRCMPVIDGCLSAPSLAILIARSPRPCCNSVSFASLSSRTPGALSHLRAAPEELLKLRRL